MTDRKTKIAKLSTGLLLASTLLGGSALAADLPGIVYVPAVEPVVEEERDIFDWDRFYGGVFIGYGFGDVVITNDVPIAFFDQTLNINGALAGLTLGKNFRVDDSLVFGVEGDIAWADMSGSAEDLVTGDGTLYASARISSIATLRGRVGIPMGEGDEVLPFLTGGIAAGHMEVSARGEDSADPLATASGWTYGFTVGGGLEIAVAEDVTLKAEYLYTDFFGSLGASPIDSNGGGTATFDFTANHLLRVGINAHF